MWEESSCQTRPNHLWWPTTDVQTWPRALVTHKTLWPLWYNIALWGALRSLYETKVDWTLLSRKITCIIFFLINIILLYSKRLPIFSSFTFRDLYSLQVKARRSSWGTRRTWIQNPKRLNNLLSLRNTLLALLNCQSVSKPEPWLEFLQLRMFPFPLNRRSSETVLSRVDVWIVSLLVLYSTSLSIIGLYLSLWISIVSAPLFSSGRIFSLLLAPSRPFSHTSMTLLGPPGYPSQLRNLSSSPGLYPNSSWNYWNGPDLIFIPDLHHHSVTALTSFLTFSYIFMPVIVSPISSFISSSPDWLLSTLPDSAGSSRTFPHSSIVLLAPYCSYFYMILWHRP